MESQEVEEKSKPLLSGWGKVKTLSFLAELGFRRKVGSPTFAVSMAFITKSMISAGNDFEPYVFEAHPDEFYRFYHDKMLCLDAKPNAAHKKLTQWERDGRLKAVITQNIDGLHQAAGSRNVLELHGSVHRNYCQNATNF